MRAFECFGATPSISVLDNPKIEVTRADRHDPQLQRWYEKLAAHCGAASMAEELPAEMAQ